MIVVLGIIVLLFAGYELYLNMEGTAQGGGSDFQSPAAIYSYAGNAGFSGIDLITAVAIALAESSGNAGAYNPEILADTPSGEGSYGLWQIYSKAHPEFSREELFDPQSNANAAYSIYEQAGNSFSPWSTFKSSAYVKHLDAANAAGDGSGNG